MSISTSTKAELSILADGVNVEIGDSYTVKGETFTLIDKYSNPDNGYQGYAYKANDGKIYIINSGSYDITNFENLFTGEGYKDWFKSNGAGRVGKAGSGSHLHKFSSYKCYIFKSSILRNSGARKNVLKTTLISTFTN